MLRIDEKPGDKWDLPRVAVDALGAAMLVTIILDLWRIFLGPIVPLPETKQCVQPGLPWFPGHTNKTWKYKWEELEVSDSIEKVCCVFVLMDAVPLVVIYQTFSILLFFWIFKGNASSIFLTIRIGSFRLVIGFMISMLLHHPYLQILHVDGSFILQTMHKYNLSLHSLKRNSLIRLQFLHSLYRRCFQK